MSSIRTRKLGKDGPEVSEIGFGLMGLSAFYGPPTPDPEAFAILDRAIELGSTFWDTSDDYKESEDMVKRYFASRPGSREKVFLATKFAAFFEADGKLVIRGDPEYVHQAIDKSLRRLGVSHVDLYYVHRIDPKTPIELTMGALAEVVKAGKAKHIGLSECSASTLRRAHAVHPVAAVQVEYSPFTLDIEYPDVQLLRTCRELGVAVVAYSPLGRGMLTGKLRGPGDFAPDDFRRIVPRFSEENFHKNLEVVEKMTVIAKTKGCTVGQLTLAWLLAQGDDIIPIPGTTKIPNLEENVGACKVTFTKDEVAELRKIIESAEVAGPRYPAAIMQTVFVDTPQL